MRERVARALVAHMNAQVFQVDMWTERYAEEQYYIHRSKLVHQWREDIKAFCTEKEKDSDGIVRKFRAYMESLGYVEVSDLVADLWQCKVVMVNGQAMLTDRKDNEDWPDGFIGHGLGD